MSGILSEKGVSNHQGHRQISDWCDDHGLKEHQDTRALLHGMYHEFVGAAKFVTGNTQGAVAEWQRASEQFGRFGCPSPPPQ